MTIVVTIVGIEITNHGDFETTTIRITKGITHSDIMIRSLTVSYSWQSLIFDISQLSSNRK